MLAYLRITLLSIRNSLKTISKSLKASRGSFPRTVSSELWQRLGAFYNLQALSRGQRRGAHLRRNNVRVIPTLKPQVNRRYSVLSMQNGANYSNLSPSKRREAPSEGANSARLFTPGKRKA